MPYKVNENGVALILIGGGVALFFHGIFTLLRARLIENMPTSKTRSAALGYAEFSGTATGPALLTAPVSARLSIWWSCEVWEKVNKDTTRLLYHSFSPNPLFLKDETGRVLIDPTGADMQCPSKKISKSMFWSARFDEALDRAGANHLVGKSFFFSEVWIREKCIPLESPLYVLGEARRADQYQGLPNRADIRQSFRDYITDAKRDPKELARADENRDGQITQEEWDKFIEIKRKEFEAAKNSVNQAERTDLLVVTASDESAQPFLISVGTESALLTRMKAASAIFVIVGPIATYFGARHIMAVTHSPLLIGYIATAGAILSLVFYKFRTLKYRGRKSI